MILSKMLGVTFSKWQFSAVQCVQSCTAELPVQCGCVQTLAGVTVGPRSLRLVKPIYRNISYSQLGITRRPEKTSLATRQSGATLRSSKYQEENKTCQNVWI